MEVEQVTQWGNALNEIDGTVTKKLEKTTLGDDGKPTWSITVSAPVEPPHGFGQLDDVWVNNLPNGLASQLVEGGRYKLKIERQGLRKDPKTGLKGDGTKASDYWLKLQEVLERLDAVLDQQQQEAEVPQGVPSEGAWENMKRDVVQESKPISRPVLGAERGNALNVVQALMTGHYTASGAYPTQEELDQYIDLLYRGAERVLELNTESEQKVRF